MTELPDSAPVAVVTGAARGIGLAIARWFLDHGHRVALLDIDAETLAATERGLHQWPSAGGGRRFRRGRHRTAGAAPVARRLMAAAGAQTASSLKCLRRRSSQTNSSRSGSSALRAETMPTGLPSSTTGR